MLPKFAAMKYYIWVFILVVGLKVLCSHLILSRTLTKSFEMLSLQSPRPQPEPAQSIGSETETGYTDNFCRTSFRIYDLGRLKNLHKNKHDQDGSIMGERNISVNEKNISGSISNSFEGEVRHVIFPKVHKAASSTTQGILLRFAVARNLSAMIPKKSTAIRIHDDRLNIKNIVPPYKHSNGLYDILANHLIFNANKLAPHFPSKTVRFAFIRDPMECALSALAYFTKCPCDTDRFSFVRHPVKYALSALKYYTTGIRTRILEEKFQQYPSDPNTAFINNPAEFFDSKQPATYSFINNRISVDLGIDTTDFEATKRSPNKICEFIKKMDRDLDIVLLVEFYDESMVLLKRLLNWQLMDILYMKINTLDSYQKNASVWHKKPVLTPENQKTFHQWAAIDYALYEHFSARFNKTIEQQPFFSEEVQVFKKMLNKVQRFCLKKDLSVPLTIEKTRFSASFEYTAHDCKLLKMNEREIVEHARTLQRI